jgi:serine/threonine protein kinase
MIANKYKLLAKLSQGSFGQVYKAENIRTGDLVAVKIEPKSGDNKSLKAEAKIYQYLAKLDGFPQLKWYGSTDKVTYLVTDLLDHSISDLVKRQDRLEMEVVLLLGKQMIQRLQVLHNYFLLHRDIKPQNFMLNVTTNKLYLIDFGFSKRYNYDGNHIEQSKISKIIGTPNFVSINVHKGIEPSRRDDIESCIYIMIYMLFGKLSWGKETDLKNMCLKKEQLTKLNKPLIPEFLKQLLIYVRTLEFDECPDYDEIIKVFDTVYKDISGLEESAYKIEATESLDD